MTLSSLNSPLVIASVEVPDSQGLIGMTICPGKHQQNALSGQFQRDLALDLDLIKSWGATAVVSLMADEELASLHVEDLGNEVEARDMLWFQLPILDQAMPDEIFERHWVYAGLRLRMLLREGKRVLVHCRSGLGRTGLISARLLIEFGMPAEQAMALVREARPGTLEATIHKHYLTSLPLPHNDAWLDRVLGCLLGGAVGDAFGYAVEFDSLEKIRQHFGNEGLTKPILQQGKLVVSDDTQMTLFTLEGILRSTDEQGAINQSRALEEIRHAYLDWYDTQQSEPGSHFGWLASRAAMRARRAPGNTCLSALKAGGAGSIENPINDSKGCGGVMRTAPIGFLQNIDLFDLAARAAALTHGHVDGWASSGVLPRIVARLIEGEEKHLAVRNSYSDGSEWGHVYGKAANIGHYLLAQKLARKMRFNPHEAIRQLGQGWVGDEALAIGMYAFLSGQSFRDTLIRATNHDGDSDSTASIAGQLWGAKYGLKDMPQAWIRRLDILDEILYLVQKLQGWHNRVDTKNRRQPIIDDSIQPCIRMIEMTHELHILGYQRIRIFPYISPSGCYWRLEWAPRSAFVSGTAQPHGGNEREIARYTSGSGWQPFEWQDVKSLSALEMAQQFLRQFPELARAGKGDDWAYAGWFTKLLGEVRQGKLPYFWADWDIDLSRGVPMHDGAPFPLPPQISRSDQASCPIE
ncbi:ADP-ribosylglycohydrolase family protein [Atlantibacter sp. RC6]|uniref:ADP-ribosylglycohydrolase family protein n=1 Tax=Atlantibacter sp. RC6 TaxID=2587036 RepID=UPI00160582F1|nr:ADP-ribosylglycohydrolase family protein [Atlantibacter sp. RC6]MBB3321753.1 ADP-ribosylglycohydrolase/protein-tyrosine phosphatase [Atlantibacter sp. RC6]